MPKKPKHHYYSIPPGSTLRLVIAGLQHLEDTRTDRVFDIGVLGFYGMDEVVKEDHLYIENLKVVAFFGSPTLWKKPAVDIRPLPIYPALLGRI